jgi:hypothetical protein
MVTDIEARIEKAAGDALEAFWTSVVESFPEIKSGNYDPMFEGLMYSEAEDWIQHWLDMNVEVVA